MPGEGSSGGPPDPSGRAFRPPFWHRRRVVVRDDSMRPTLEPGDRLWVDTGAYRSRAPRVGEIVVVVDPEQRSRWLVKRVRDVTSSTVSVAGDAGGPSRDSRRFGPVDRRLVIGRVYRRYFPAARRQDL